LSPLLGGGRVTRKGGIQRFATEREERSSKLIEAT